MRVTRILVAAGLLAAPMLAAQPALAAPSPVQFTRIQYDSPGKDSSKNTAGEYVTVKNVSKKPVTLTNWTLRDETGFTYKFGKITLKPGKSLVVSSGVGRNSATKVYWGRKQHVWNNDGDTATLRTNKGKTADTCGWKRLKPGYVNCR
ncbi:lamin tail domain-containing protein [Bailinhaonella thermotolerans]|nr:lamin tail domain-containing protein [Bailinhaonella thermotolerans]